MFRVSRQLLTETSFILRRNERDMIKIVYWASCTVPLFFADFKVTWIFTTYFRNIKFNEKPSNGSRVVTKLTIAFRNFAKAPKHEIKKGLTHHRTLYLQTGHSNHAITKKRTQTLCNQRSHNQQSRYSQLVLTKHAQKQIWLYSIFHAGWPTARHPIRWLVHIKGHCDSEVS